jgi:hypothetical protein
MNAFVDFFRYRHAQCGNFVLTLGQVNIRYDTFFLSHSRHVFDMASGRQPPTFALTKLVAALFISRTHTHTHSPHRQKAVQLANPRYFVLDVYR